MKLASKDGGHVSQMGIARGESSSGTFRSRSGFPSVMVLDSSCFTLPYDYSLCEALADHGCAVTLVRSESANTPWQTRTSFQVWNHFYERSQARAREGASGPLWKLGKLAEHARDM